MRDEQKQTPQDVCGEACRLSASVSFLSSPPLPALLLAPSVARSLTLAPRSLLLNRTETLAKQANYEAQNYPHILCLKPELEIIAAQK